MRVLLDEQLPVDLALEIGGHLVDTVVSRGWAGLKNGELLARMQGQFDVLVTMDCGIEFQHQLTKLPFGAVVVRARSNRIADLRPLVPTIVAAIGATKPGTLQHIGA
jgi:hypothetical protein